ncbi:galectin 17 isoform X2 [Enoplosus armatus]|uniref:galectin 17 isoform X2 n=1 Tax=Enoplosus armatus TaxID=215367 RepID=UPI0039949B60
METIRTRHWFFIHLQCFLVGSLVDSSSLSSIAHSQLVISSVGNQAVLPCSWKSRLGEAAPSVCHIQWMTPADTVFELRGELKWQAEEFVGRVEVPEERLESGDCSLIINDVQIGDAGRYESFMVVDGLRSKKTKVFIQSVKLSVFDHKSLQSQGPGEDLVLDLHTRHSVRVVFQGRNSSEWSDLWMRGDEDSQRLEKHPLREQLTIKKLKSSDDGTYKVHQIQENQVPTDDAAKSSCSALLILSVLVTSLQILHL